MAKYKVDLDRKNCIGCGACAVACPANFIMDGDKSRVNNKEISDKELKCNKESEEVCPVEVIKITKL